MPAPLAPEKRRSKIRLTRFTNLEDERIQRAAAQRGVPVGVFLREVALDAIAADAA